MVSDEEIKAEQLSAPWRPTRTHRRAATTVFDQALSTITNAGLVVAVSSQQSVATFGDFSLAYAVFGFVLGMQRAAIADQLLVTSSEGGDVDATNGAQFVRSIAVSSLLAAVCMVVAGVALGGVIGSYLLWLGLGAWAALIQDGLRFYAMAVAKPGVAVVMDSAWLAAFAASLLLISDVGSVATAGAWGATAILSLIIGLVVLRPPSMRAVRRLGTAGSWIRVPFGLEFIAITIGGLLLLSGLRVFSGPTATAAVAAVLAVFRLPRSLVGGLRLFYIPRLRSRLGQSRYRIELAMWGGVITGLVLSWLALTQLAEGVVEVLLGETWTAASMILPAGAAFEMAASLAVLWSDHLKVADRGHYLVAGRLVFTSSYLLGALVGGSLAGTQGAATGLAVGALVGLILWLSYVGRNSLSQYWRSRRFCSKSRATAERAS